jgi:polar amino acid transport system substrate-binding protein
MVVAALALTGAACGDDDDTTAGPTTTLGGGGTTTPTTAGGGARPIDCDGTNAYETEIGDPADFEPVTADTLTVVTSLPGPGFFEGSDDDPTKVTSGYEYAIAAAMQEAFGLGNLVIRNVSFDAIVAGTVRDYDVALSQISITCERAKVVRFSMPYFQSNQGVLVKAGFSKPIASVEDAKKLRWGVQTGTTALDLLETIDPDSDPLVYQQLPDAYTALQADQVEAVLIDTAINLGQAARSKGAFEVVAQFDQPGGADQYGALLPKDSPNIGAVNAVFDELQESGELAQLAAEHLTADPGDIPVIKVS